MLTTKVRRKTISENRNGFITPKMPRTSPKMP